MGVLPLLKEGDGRASLKLSGDEILDIRLPEGTHEITPRQMLVLSVRDTDGGEQLVELQSRLDTENEIAYFQSGGILQFVLNISSLRLVDREAG